MCWQIFSINLSICFSLFSPKGGSSIQPISLQFDVRGDNTLSLTLTQYKLNDIETTGTLEAVTLVRNV